MKDALELLVEEIQQEFDAVHGSHVEHRFGSLENNEHGCWPLIGWDEPGGDIGPQREVGGFDPADSTAEESEDAGDDKANRPTPGSVATLKPNVVVECWAEGRAEARLLMQHVILAASNLNKFGLTFSRYESAKVAHADGGSFIFRLFGEFELSVVAETEHTVGYITLRRHAWAVTSEGETVNGENGIP